MADEVLVPTWYSNFTVLSFPTGLRESSLKAEALAFHLSVPRAAQRVWLVYVLKRVLSVDYEKCPRMRSYVPGHLLAGNWPKLKLQRSRYY